MKIGIVTPTYHPYPGGVPEHVYHTYVELTRLGHEVRVLTTRFGRGEAPNEHHVIRLGRSVPVPANGSICPVAFDVRMRSKVRNVLAAERFDLLHLHEPLMPALCLSVLAEADAPVVGTFHANTDGAYTYRLFRPVLEGYMNRLGARIAVSEAARTSVSRHFGGDYAVIPNGVDVQRFASAKPLPRAGDGDFNILFVGRLEPRKGAKFLFRAMPAILKEVPQARLTVVGGGPLSAYYTSHLPQSVLDRVNLVGRVSGETLARHYAGADVFCSPATGGESFGIVLLEAMAAGAPVVASDIPGYRDVVSDGRNGLLVPRGSPDDIAAAVVRLAKDAALRERLVEAAHRDVLQYSWDRVTRRVLDVYESVVGRPSGSVRGEAADQVRANRERDEAGVAVG